jgi:outer membrane receptor protein involved in Fe transport
LFSTLSSLALAQTPSTPPDPGRAIALNLPSQPLEDALVEFSRETGLRVMLYTELGRGIISPKVAGTFTPAAALELLLRDAALRFQFLDAQTVEVLPKRAQNTGDSWEPTRRASDDPVRLASVAVTAGPSSTSTARAGETDQLSQSDLDAVTRQKTSSHRDLEEIVVTGTHIQGIAPVALTITLTQQDIRRAGQNDLGEAIRALPQNFGGGQNPGVQVNAGLEANQNVSGGSSLNLRGLGPDATLTLVNGHRLSYDSFSQGVDIASIPLAAVDRIEIVPDGASAVYGSDAVAGVANVILKRDYDGFSISARAGRATDGGDFQQQYSAVGGSTWATGGFIAVYDFEQDRAIDASQRGYTTNLETPYSLLPSQKHHDIVLSAHQDLGAAATFRADVMYNERGINQSRNTLGLEPFVDTHTRSYLVSPTLTFNFPASWTVELNASKGQDNTHEDFQYYFYPPRKYGLALTDCKCNSITTAEVTAQGPVWELPAGAARTAVGGGYVKNLFDEPSFYAYPNGSSSSSQSQGTRESYHAYAEVFVPIVGPDQHIPVAHSLSVTGAVRYENYRTIGSVSTPKVGIMYAPTVDFSIKGSWGRSFKVPTLLQSFASTRVYLDPAAYNGGPASATALYTSGGNTELKPERADTWSTTLDIHPEYLPGLNFEVGYFNVHYTNRVLAPIADSAHALTNPLYSQFVTLNPSIAQQQATIALASAGLTNSSRAPYDPANVIAIINNINTNVAAQAIHGVDVSGTYETRVGEDFFDLSAQATWLRSTQINTIGQAAFPLAGTIFNPPREKARAGLSWRHRDLTLSGFVNYQGGLTDTKLSVPTQGASMITEDLTALWIPSEAPSILRNTELLVSVLNILNRRPPFLDNGKDLVPYDSTNYSPIGRFVSVTLTKRW